jgi:hypothetical protein
VQVSSVIQADPWKLADDLNTLALANTIQIVTKTYSAGKFITIVDDAAGASQVAEVIVGDPDTVSDAISTILATATQIDLVIPTFSAAHFVVVYR